jgi:hypothetical protein
MIAAVVGCLAMVAGCGGNEEDRVALVPVSGTLTLDGKPLEGVIISFLPDASNAKPQTDGGDLSGPGGTFEAKYRNRNGLAPGKYTVTVARPGKGEPGDIAGISPVAGVATPPTHKGQAGKKEKEPPPWPYGDASTTPLKQDVAPGGSTGLKIELKSSAR